SGHATVFTEGVDGVLHFGVADALGGGSLAEQFLGDDRVKREQLQVPADLAFGDGVVERVRVAELVDLEVCHGFAVHLEHHVSPGGSHAATPEAEVGGEGDYHAQEQSDGDEPQDDGVGFLVHFA